MGQTLFTYGQYPCGTKPLSDIQRLSILKMRRQYEQARLGADTTKKTTDSLKAKTLDDGVTYFPIRAHIARKNKKGGFSIGELNNSIAVTNRHFRVAGKGIQFYLAGTDFDFVDDSTFYDYSSSKKDSLGRTQEKLITGRYGIRNAINIYFLNSIKADGSEAGGYAYFPDTTYATNHVFMASRQSNDNLTLPHELGHYFQLAHTFDSSADPDTADRELVTRLKIEKGKRLLANCETKGDLLCDTPADPYDRVKAIFSGCAYNLPASKMADANGDAFDPQMNNIMAYFQCGAFMFTGGQLNVMGGLALQKRLNPDNKYTVNGPAAWQPTVVKTPLLRKVKLANPGGVLIAWADSSTNETGFLIERATTKNGPFLGIGGVQPNDTLFTDRNIVASQTYFYRVKPSNTTTAAYTKIDSIKIDSIQICAPLYAVGCSEGDGINTFILKAETILNNQKTGCGTGGFRDYSTLTATVLSGRKYPFLVSVMQDTTGFYPQSVSIWIDANRDGLFAGSVVNPDSSEMLFQGKMARGFDSLIDTIAIPKGLKPGSYRIRVRTQRATFGLVFSPCNTYKYGEAEDYTLVVPNIPARLSAEIIAENIPTEVYPNPSDGQKLFVRVPTDAKQTVITLHTLTGQPISFQQQPIDANLLSVRPNQKLQTGMYILKAHSANKVYTHKIIVTE